MNTLSVNLILENRPCLVVGAGEVACRKIDKLLEASAMVTVIATAYCEEVLRLARSNRIRVFTRPYQSNDVRGYVLVIAATNDHQVNEHVFRDAENERVLCNVVDDPPHCTFYFPAVSKKGQLQIAISSQGALPFATKRLRRILDSYMESVDWETWWQQATRLRDHVLALRLKAEEQDQFFDLFFTRTLKRSGRIVVTPLDDETFSKMLTPNGHREGENSQYGPFNHLGEPDVAE